MYIWVTDYVKITYHVINYLLVALILYLLGLSVEASLSIPACIWLLAIVQVLFSGEGGHIYERLVWKRNDKQAEN